MLPASRGSEAANFCSLVEGAGTWKFNDELAVAQLRGYVDAPCSAGRFAQEI